VEYLYAFLSRQGDRAIVIFRFDETDKAIRSLTAHGATVLAGERVYRL